MCQVACLSDGGTQTFAKAGGRRKGVSPSCHPRDPWLWDLLPDEGGQEPDFLRNHLILVPFVNFWETLLSLRSLRETGGTV